MQPSPESRPGLNDDTGVADVRRVREAIAALYNGDIQKHVADTHAIVEPLIEKLGLKYGVPAVRKEEQHSTATG